MLTKTELLKGRKVWGEFQTGRPPSETAQYFTALHDMALAYIELRERVEGAQRYGFYTQLNSRSEAGTVLDDDEGEYIRRSDVVGEE